MEYFLKSHTCSDIMECTHLSLIGGKYNISSNDKKEFYNLYINELKEKKRLFLVEKIRYPCWMYIDFDKIENEDIEKQIVETCRMLPNAEKGVISKRIEGIDIGLHVNFTNIKITNKDEALSFLHQYFSKFSKFYDVSVYNIGLRMIGSCKGIAVDRIYIPKYYISDEKIKTIKTKQISSTLLELCTILHNDGIYKSNFIESTTKDIMNIERPINKHIDENAINIDFSFIHTNYKNIQGIFNPKYKDKRIYTNSKFCLNINSFHKNAKMYFKIIIGKSNKYYIKMHCSCLCEKQKPYCKNFQKKILLHKNYNLYKYI